MNYRILTIPEFDKNIKQLNKKYKNIKYDIISLMKGLKSNKRLGIHIVNNCYKIRLANSSIPTGKRGGFRVITYYIDKDKNIYLMSIYSKSDLENITEQKIKELLKEIE